MSRFWRFGVWVPCLTAAVACGESEPSDPFGSSSTAPSVVATAPASITPGQSPTGVPTGAPSTLGSPSVTPTSPPATTTAPNVPPPAVVPSVAPTTSPTTTGPGLTETAPTTSASTTNPTSSNPTSTDTPSTGTSSMTTTTTTATTTEEETDPPVVLDCNAAMPASGAERHSGNGTGGEGNLAWEIWSNTGEGELETYGVPAFSAMWNEAGGYLGRLGYEWGGFGDTPVPYESMGTITAQFVANKSGSGGDVYSYIGMYGWSSEPCVEWYVIEDSFKTMPVNPGTTTLKSDKLQLDDGEYFVYTRPTSGNGGTRCSGETEWIQYYSIRKTARRCGEISLTAHFDAWKGLGMPLGNILEAKILVEVGGGVGRVDFPVANVMVQ